MIDLLKEFLQFLRLNRNASAHTVSAYESDLRQFLAFTASLRAKPPDRLSPADLDLGAVRGFLVESDLEEQMKNDKKIDRRERALESFDSLAKDRWVLFVGPMINLDAEGFQVAVAFIPESRRDKMAVTRLWFNVTISQIKGYRPVLLREGQETAVLARYQGNSQASPAYDLVGMGLW